MLDAAKAACAAPQARKTKNKKSVEPSQ